MTKDMTNDIQTAQPGGPQQGEIILYQPDETVRLERLRVGGLCPGMVRLEDDTVWLTQQQMAELFQTTRNNVTLHIGNIFKEGELEESSVRKESLLTASDGKRYRKIDFFVRTKKTGDDAPVTDGWRSGGGVRTDFRLIIWPSK